MTEEEIDEFYSQVEVLRLPRTGHPTVWVMPDGVSTRTVSDRPILRKATKAMGDEELERLRKSLELFS
jgi:hypothetical protein